MFVWAFREIGASFFLSRRAHLYTTDKSAVLLLALQVQAPAEAADVALLAEGSDNHASVIIGTAERQSQQD